MTDASEAGRALVAHRPRITLVCEACQREFQARPAGGKRAPRACSSTCRSRLHRREKKAQTATA